MRPQNATDRDYTVYSIHSTQKQQSPPPPSPRRHCLMAAGWSANLDSITHTKESWTDAPRPRVTNARLRRRQIDAHFHYCFRRPCWEYQSRKSAKSAIYQLQLLQTAAAQFWTFGGSDFFLFLYRIIRNVKRGNSAEIILYPHLSDQRHMY